jgi:hypothetical protein
LLIFPPSGCPPVPFVGDEGADPTPTIQKPHRSDINLFLVSQMLCPGPNRVNGLFVGDLMFIYST